MKGIKRKLIWSVFIAYCLFVLYLTIFSRQPGHGKMDLRFMWSYREYFAGNPARKKDVIQNLENIAFFIPFGLLHPVKKWGLIIVSGFLFSVMIEAIQYFGGYGLCELDDVICNTLGVVIGVMVWKKFAY